MKRFTILLFLVCFVVGIGCASGIKKVNKANDYAYEKSTKVVNEINEILPYVAGLVSAGKIPSDALEIINEILNGASIIQEASIALQPVLAVEE